MANYNATLLQQKFAHAIPHDGSVNPFVFVAAALEKGVFPDIPYSFTIQLYITSGIFAFQTVMFIISLAIRATSGDFWAFSRHGTLIVPHFAVTWQICTVLFLGALQSFLYLTVAHTAAEDVPNFMMAQLFCWSPSWLGGMFVAWSLFAADALASQRATTPPSRVRRLFHSPMFINLHFILVAVVCLSVMFGVSYWASQQYTILIADFRIIQRDLLDHWAPLYATLPYDEVATALKANTPVLQDLLDHLKHFTLAFRIAWGWWWAFTLYLYGLLIWHASQYFAGLRRDLRAGRDAGLMPTPDRMKDVKKLRAAWWNAAITCGCVAFVGVVFTAVCGYLAIRTEVAISSGLSIQVETLVATYIFVLCGTPASILAVLRSIQAHPRRRELARFVPLCTSGLDTETNSFRTPAPTILLTGTSTMVDLDRRAQEEGEKDESREGSFSGRGRNDIELSSV